MSSVNDGGPAFPNAGDPACGARPDFGLSLRDYFAAKALAGLLADPTFNVAPERTVEIAYQYAEAMLTERAKTPGIKQKL